MERVIHYRTVIHSLHEDYVQPDDIVSDATADSDIVADEEHREYMSMRVG